jgi:hypothetical protein
MTGVTTKTLPKMAQTARNSPTKDIPFRDVTNKSAKVFIYENKAPKTMG